MVQFELSSLIIYLTVAVSGYLCIQYANRYKQRKKLLSIFFGNGIFVIIFTLLAVLRKVDKYLGGTDALNYIKCFKYSLENDSSFKALIREPLFLRYCQLIRHFTSNYYVFFFITYSVIAISYCIFIKKYCPSNVEYTPFVLLLFPYLKSFCTLRTGLAVAIFLIGLTFIEKKKILSLILIISTIFIHFMSVLFVFLYIFYFFYKKKIDKLESYKLGIFILSYAFLFFCLAIVLQKLIILSNIFINTKYLYYIDNPVSTIFIHWPMYFAQTVLYVCMLFLDKKVFKSNGANGINKIKVFCVYDFIMIPSALILGMWRFNEYLYIARLIMWSQCLRVILFYFNNRSKKIMRFIFFIIFITWFIFRIYSEYSDLRIMPYRLWYM